MGSLPFLSRDVRPKLSSAVAVFADRAYIRVMDQRQTAEAGGAYPAVSFETILTDFELLDDWEDRYRYVIELGRTLEPLPEDARNAANKVQGCVSQVWLATSIDPGSGPPRLHFLGVSDAHIVRGLIAILFALYSGKRADEILQIDANASLAKLHLKEHLTPQRSNGLLAMVQRIRRDANVAAEAAPSLH